MATTEAEATVEIRQFKEQEREMYCISAYDVLINTRLAGRVFHKTERAWREVRGHSFVIPNGRRHYWAALIGDPDSPHTIQNHRLKFESGEWDAGKSSWEPTSLIRVSFASTATCGQSTSYG